MSSRQRQRLLNLQNSSSLKKEDDVEVEEEDEEEDDEPMAPKRPMFAFDPDSDDDSDNDEEGEQENEKEQLTSDDELQSPPPPRQPAAPLVPPPDEDAFLNELISQINQQADQSTATTQFSTLAFAFSIQQGELDLDMIARRRLGQFQNLVEGAGPAAAPQGQGGQKKPSSSSRKTLLFGQPLSQWSKPIPYAFGGLGLSRVKWGEEGDQQWSKEALFLREYKFDFSDEHTRLCIKLQSALEVDPSPNRLVLFTVNTQGSHPAALLALSLHHSAAPNLPLAQSFLRRALYCYDCVLTDTFVSAVHGGVAAMSPHLASNLPFYQCVARHMYLQAESGAYSAAAGVGRVLVALGYNWARNEARRAGLSSSGMTPKNDQQPNLSLTARQCDPHCILLSLDSFILQAAKQEFKALSSSGTSSRSGSRHLDIFRSMTADGGISLDGAKLLALPNWAFSSALIEFLYESATNSSTPYSENNRSPAERLLSQAALMHPYVLVQLASTLPLATSTKTRLLEAAATIKTNVIARNTAVGLSQAALLGARYVAAAGHLWDVEGVSVWLLKAAEIAAAESSTALFDRSASAVESLLFYSACPEILPPNHPSQPHVDRYQPMEESLADPRLLEFDVSTPNLVADNARIKEMVGKWGAQVGLGEDGCDGVAQAGGVGLNGLLAEFWRAAGQMAAQPEDDAEPANARPRADPPVVEQLARPGAPRGQRGNIDLSAPLLQLFLQTLFPFYHA